MMRESLAVMAALIISGCNRSDAYASVAGGDPKLGKDLAVQYGCPACHDIPDMPTSGFVGPPLRGIAGRTYLVGTLSNTPENMIRWIRTPRRLQPDTAMPDMGISEEKARDLAAFLYTLR